MDNAGEQSAIKAATETLRHHGVVMHPDDIAGLVWDVRALALEEAANVAEELPIGGGALSSWIGINESPMRATRRHIAHAIRALKGQPCYSI